MISGDEKFRKNGQFEESKVRRFLFSLVSAAVGLSVLVIILAIWDYVGGEFAYRSIATLGTLASGGLVFGWVNIYFGDE